MSKEKKVWTGWDLSGDSKILTIWVFDKSRGKLLWRGRLTFSGPISEGQAYLEAVRFQMVENEELPAECATMDIKDVRDIMANMPDGEAEDA